MFANRVLGCGFLPLRVFDVQIDSDRHPFPPLTVSLKSLLSVITLDTVSRDCLLRSLGRDFDRNQTEIAVGCAAAAEITGELRRKFFD